MLVYDIEADNLLDDVTVVHCICTSDEYGKYVFAKAPPPKWEARDGWVYKGTVEEGVQYLKDYPDFKVAHNQMGYDLQVLLKLHNTDMLGDNLIDTLVLSRLLFPENRKHSIEFWAEHLALPQSKIENKDWSKLTLNMLLRCCSDVEINKQVYDYLIAKVEREGGSKVWAEPLKLEQSLSVVHAKQVTTGVKFDVFKASALVKLFNGKIDVLESEIIEGAPLVKVVPKLAAVIKGGDPRVSTVEKPFLKNGGLKKAVVTYFEGSDTVVKGAFTKVSWRQMNLNSPKEVKEWLLSEGWRPTEYTPTGSPKITEELLGLEGSTIGIKYKELAVLKHRCRYLLSHDKAGKPKGAVTKVRRKDCRVPADAITLGTNTGRYRHTGAVCNLPRPSSPYGKEIRSLFTVDKGWNLVGVDLSAIESRMLSHFCYHYPGGKELADTIIDGDFHQHNADLLGCDRNTAKTYLYAVLYGAGKGKLASILGCSLIKATGLIKKFWDGNKPIALLIKDLEKSLKAHPGWITGLDGRRVYVRSEHRLLNTLLQSSAAVVFKRWMLMVDNWVKDDDSINQIIAMHDELQMEVRDTVKPESVIEKMCSLATKAGEFYKLNVPIEADGSHGKTYADTH